MCWINTKKSEWLNMVHVEEKQSEYVRTIWRVNAQMDWNIRYLLWRFSSHTFCLIRDLLADRSCMGKSMLDNNIRSNRPIYKCERKKQRNKTNTSKNVKPSIYITGTWIFISMGKIIHLLEHITGTWIVYIL